MVAYLNLNHEEVERGILKCGRSTYIRIRVSGHQIGEPCNFIISLISLHSWLFNETTVVYTLHPNYQVSQIIF